jgi:AcrR family transcriptional regulator
MTEKTLSRTERRKQATHERLKQAAAHILTTEGLSACSITAITREADLGYGTFYVHYQERDDIIWEVFYDYFERLRSETDARLSDTPSPLKEYRSWITVFEYALQTHEAFVSLFSDAGRGILTTKIQTYFADVYFQNLEAGTYSVPSAMKGLPLDAIAHAITGAQIRLMNWWLRDAKRYTAEQVAGMLFQFTYHTEPPIES